jgi:two-component system, chemotaxis family, chemotaxis protein CheY
MGMDEQHGTGMSARLQVLVVDDDVVSRMVLMHLVDGSGPYDVTEAEDGEQAWRLLEDGLRPAITFCDLRMPGLSGLELLARVKADARIAAMPFVLASAANGTDTVAEANARGAFGYLVKPFRPEDVRALLAALPAAGQQFVPPDEVPAQSLRRLGIDAARLELYLGGLQRQLGAANADIAALLAGGEHDAARATLARLREGCAMLGLASAAAALASLTAQPAASLSLTAIARVLDLARQRVLHQTAQAHALPGA